MLILSFLWTISNQWLKAKATCWGSKLWELYPRVKDICVPIWSHLHAGIFLNITSFSPLSLVVTIPPPWVTDAVEQVKHRECGYGGGREVAVWTQLQQTHTVHCLLFSGEVSVIIFAGGEEEKQFHKVVAMFLMYCAVSVSVHQIIGLEFLFVIMSFRASSTVKVAFTNRKIPLLLVLEPVW